MNGAITFTDVLTAAELYQSTKDLSTLWKKKKKKAVQLSNPGSPAKTDPPPHPDIYTSDLAMEQGNHHFQQLYHGDLASQCHVHFSSTLTSLAFSWTTLSCLIKLQIYLSEAWGAKAPPSLKLQAHSHPAKLNIMVLFELTGVFIALKDTSGSKSFNLSRPIDHKKWPFLKNQWSTITCMYYSSQHLPKSWIRPS